MNPFRVGARAAGELARRWRQRSQRTRLAPLYAPDADDLDLTAHIREAINWLKRAQDAGVDRGVSYGVFFGDDFDVSYPETTGYICSSFVEQERLSGESELLRRAIEMGDWEIAVQLPEGAVMGGKFNAAPTPAVFNTGMVLLGWSALASRTGEQRFGAAAARASEWLLSVQEPDGRWVRGNSIYAKSEGTLYNVMAAWGLCEAGVALNEDSIHSGGDSQRRILPVPAAPQRLAAGLLLEQRRRTPAAYTCLQHARSPRNRPPGR